MACSCRGTKRAGATTSGGATISGFRYTAPDKTVQVFDDLLKAKAAQRRNGGGTIKQLINGA